MSYKCEIIADSLSPQGNRLTSFIVTYPRIVHAEMCRHRMFSRNTASSRAIPFEKMVKDIEENPFIPIAWQKAHKGMQGSEYWEENEYGELIDNTYKVNVKNCAKSTWLRARDNAIKEATTLSKNSITKQLCNRLLEPFMWTTELISGTEWDNFFELRCPQYVIKGINGNKPFRSKKDALKKLINSNVALYNTLNEFNEIDWLTCNKSQAEIHIQQIAEMMWDNYNESKPKELKAGEYHVPFGDNFNVPELCRVIYGEYTKPGEQSLGMYPIKIATARCARLSYTTLGSNPKIDYEADIKLHDRLAEMSHWSPFEHCSRAMCDEEYYSNIRGEYPVIVEDEGEIVNAEIYPQSYNKHVYEGIYGWCRNFKGFISYRHLNER